jgi:hypothetical protein
MGTVIAQLDEATHQQSITVKAEHHVAEYCVIRIRG